MIVLCLETTCALRDFQQMVALSTLVWAIKKASLYTLEAKFSRYHSNSDKPHSLPLQKYVAWCKIPLYVIEYKSQKLHHLCCSQTIFNKLPRILSHQPDSLERSSLFTYLFIALFYLMKLL